MQYTFIAAADNYDPVPRNYLRGTLITGQGHDGKSDILTFEAAPKDAHNAMYILDFGSRVEVRCVAGWRANGIEFFLKPFPLSQGTRVDDGRPIDMSNWMLGPHRAFHLKLKEESRKESPYVRGEVTSQGVRVGGGDYDICQCCRRSVWCGGWSVCFECRMNDCESVHPELAENMEGSE